MLIYIVRQHYVFVVGMSLAILILSIKDASLSYPSNIAASKLGNYISAQVRCQKFNRRTLSQLQHLFENGHIDFFAFIVVHSVHFTSRLFIVREFEHWIEIGISQADEIMTVVVFRQIVNKINRQARQLFFLLERNITIKVIVSTNQINTHGEWHFSIHLVDIGIVLKGQVVDLLAQGSEFFCE